MNDSTSDSTTVRGKDSPGVSSVATQVERDVPVYRTFHDMATDGLSITISQALAEITDIPATDLVADFAEHADPDALDRLFRTRPSDPDLRSDGHVVLPIHGYHVTVYGDGRILIVDCEPTP